MAYEYSDLLVSVKQWASNAVETGWIDQAQADFLMEERHESARELFSQPSSRPLVVAFMGGTGVGKSSLLNKLAGQSIAKTGVVRPTSKEVTLFHHHSVALEKLQQTFPLQQIQIAQHSDDGNQQVLWIDMPDFDSTEEKNRSIVMQWLPFVDVLIYVVSPERYRDNKAWQLLLAEGANHAWLFVMNQWDRGESIQFDDFKKQLAKAGFQNPIIFKTICHETADQSEDQLAELQASIGQIANDKTVVHLEQRGLTQKKNQLSTKLHTNLQSLGDETQFDALRDYKESAWEETSSMLKQGFEWPIKQVSQMYSKKISVKKDQVKMWDEWAQSRFNDFLDDLVLMADQKGLPSTPLRNYLQPLRSSAEKIIHTQSELGCRQSLLHPGNAVQRFVLKMMAVFEILLPLIAMGVVGFQVFYGFYDSAISDEAYLGTDFAIHSVLLIALCWLIPFFIQKKMQPSLQKAALKGLNKGLDAALARISLDLDQVISDQQSQYQEISGSLKTIMQNLDEVVGISESEVNLDQLNRMLI